MRSLLILVLLLTAFASAFAQKDSTNITGTWRSMLDKEKPGFIFTKEGFVTMLRGNSREGGNPGDNAEGQNFMRYKVGKIKGFFTIDFILVKIVKNKQVEQERATGIFVYLRDGRIRMALPPPGTPRPTKLVSGETIVLTRQ